MSNVGKVPVQIPSGVNINLNGNLIEVKGPKGTLSYDAPKGVEVSQEGSVVIVKPKGSGNANFHGLVRTLIANMVVGVTEGYEKRLKIVGVGYRAAMEGNKLVINIGFSHPVTVEAPEGITLNVEKNNLVIVSGINKEIVGRIAAEIRDIKKPEPYKGKGIMYEDEKIRRKAGKSLKGAEGGGK